MSYLRGRAVVITGAGRGLGEAYARAVASTGGAVVVNDVDGAEASRVASEIIDAGGRAVAHPADVSDWTQAEELVERCVREFGAVDGLVNNAGCFALSLPQDQRPEDVRRLVDVNLVGTIACGVHALRHMVTRGCGVVVNVTSAEQMGKTASAVYGATKAGIAALTYSWSADVRAHGVRVNAVSPNAHTRMAEIYRAHLGVEGGQNVGLPPDVNAPLVVYLLSDLSAAVTGQVLRMQGDELMLCTHPAVLAPVLHRDAGWTVEAIAEAVEVDLRHRLQPVGLHRVRSRVVE